MRSIIRIALIVLGISILPLHAEDARDKRLKELDAIKAELKPLREKAYLESDVIAARRQLDDAYKNYWESVRAAMLRLDPAKKALIKKDIALRKETGAIRAIPSGSRASDYEKKAAVETAPKKSP